MNGRPRIFAVSMNRTWLWLQCSCCSLCVCSYLHYRENNYSWTKWGGRGALFCGSFFGVYQRRMRNDHSLPETGKTCIHTQFNELHKINDVTPLSPLSRPGKILRVTRSEQQPQKKRRNAVEISLSCFGRTWNVMPLSPQKKMTLFSFTSQAANRVNTINFGPPRSRLTLFPRFLLD